MPQPPGQVSAHPVSSHVGRIARMVSHRALPGGKRGYHELVGTTLYMYIFLRYVCKQSLAPLLSCYSTLAGLGCFRVANTLSAQTHRTLLDEVLHRKRSNSLCRNSEVAQLRVRGQAREQVHKPVEVAIGETNAPATRSKRIDTIRARPP